MKRKVPTSEDRVEAIRIALSGIAADDDLGKLRTRLDPMHPKNNTFPGEVFLELAADAIEEAVASRRSSDRVREDPRALHRSAPLTRSDPPQPTTHGRGPSNHAWVPSLPGPRVLVSVARRRVVVGRWRR